MTLSTTVPPGDARESAPPDAGFFARANVAWQVTGGCLLAPILVTVLVTARLQDWDIPTYTWLLWLQLPIFMLHEFEEYVLPGGFKSFFNHDTVFASPEPGDNTPLNDGYVFAVNIGMAWGWAILGALLAPIAPWVGLGLILWNVAINCVQHAVIFQIRHEGYNPGLITTMLLLVPYSTFVIIYVIQNGVLTPMDWVLATLLAIGVFLSLLAVTARKRKRAT